MKMEEYKKPYFILWHGIDRALEEMEKQNYGNAAELLKRAQTDAEEAYISAEET